MATAAVIMLQAVRIGFDIALSAHRRGLVLNQFLTQHMANARCKTSRGLENMKKTGRSGQAIGGWGGIRTPGRLAPSPVFKTGAINRSATHPVLSRLSAPRRPVQRARRILRYGVMITEPVVSRPSSARCAFSTSESAKRAPISTLILPAAMASNRALAPSSRSWRSDR